MATPKQTRTDRGVDDTETGQQSPPHTAESLAVFQKEFKDFQSWKDTLRSVYDKSKHCFDKLIATMPSHATELKNSLISEEDSSALNRVMERDPTVLILGLTNCGKSSLANELLEGRILPTAEIPCTSRVVLLKYSKKEYVKLIDSHNKILDELPLHGKRRVPKEFVVVAEGERGQREKVQTVVEVGLNNKLLESGVKLIDAPGMSENTTINDIVKECVQGVLQLMIYVLDGNNGFRLEDQNILGSLYDIAPELSIFYTCNKIETNLSASMMDMASDDEDESDAADNPEEKKLRVFQSLIDYGFINSREKMQTCRYFHGISTREISRARRSGKPDQYSKAFLDMKKDFMTFAGEMLKNHMLYAATSLHQVQKHFFEFFIRDVLRQGTPNASKADDIGHMVIMLRKDRARLHRNARLLLDKKRERISTVLGKAIEDKRHEIIMAVQNMKYSPIKVGDTVERNEMVEQLQHQVQRLVVMKVTQAIQESLHPEIEDFVEEMTKGTEGQLSVINQAASDGFRNVLSGLSFSLSVPKFAGLLNLTSLSWNVARHWLVDDLPSKLTSKWKGAVVDVKWRNKIAMDTLERLNRGEMTEIVCKEIGLKIDLFFNNLHKDISRIETLNKASKAQERESRLVASSIASQLCKVICETDALINTCQHGQLVLQKDQKLDGGFRNIVFKVTKWPGRKNVIARVAKETETIGSKVAELISINRSLSDHPSLLPVLGLTTGTLDGQIRTMVIMPEIKFNLWERMVNGKLGRLSLRRRVQLGKEIAEGCEFLWQQGFPIADLRITNILLLPVEPAKKHWNAKINMIKPRDDNIMYPDDKVPFHIAPECYGGGQQRRHSIDMHGSGRFYRSISIDSHSSDRLSRRNVAENDCGNDQANVYAFGILLWMLIHGRFVRPDYAETTDIHQIRRSVTIEQQHPSLAQLQEHRHYKGIVDLLRMCWSDSASERPLWGEVIDRINSAISSIPSTLSIPSVTPTTKSMKETAV